MADKIRIGIIGFGGQSQQFVKSYLQHPAAEVVAVCDISENRLNKAKEMGIPHLYKDLSICDRDDLDLISIHTPDHLHAEPFIRALQAGKHVFVEKPMADNEEDLMRMVEAAKNSDRKTMVGHILRFSPLFKATKEMIGQGVLGEIFYLEGDYIHDLKYQQFKYDQDLGMNWYLEKENPMIGGGIHPFDILRWYAGCDAVEVQAYANHISFPEMEQPDSIVAIYKFANGSMAKVAALYGSIGPMAEDYHVAVYGTKGTINRHNISLTGMHEFMKLPFQVKGHPYEPEAAHVIDCILQDKPTLCDALDGARSTIAVLKAKEAIETGKAVKIPHIG